MNSTTLCFIIEGRPVKRVLLGMKKTGFGRGKYNGFGGKLQPGETVRQAAVRELREECELTADVAQLEAVGTLDFIFPAQPELDHDVHIFLVRQWQGQPQETVEMKPVWIPVADIPYEDMWQDDRYWLPQVLQGESVQGQVIFAANQEDIADCKLTFQSVEDSR